VEEDHTREKTQNVMIMKDQKMVLVQKLDLIIHGALHLTPITTKFILQTV